MCCICEHVYDVIYANLECIWLFLCVYKGYVKMIGYVFLCIDFIFFYINSVYTIWVILICWLDIYIYMYISIGFLVLISFRQFYTLTSQPNDGAMWQSTLDIRAPAWVCAIARSPTRSDCICCRKRDRSSGNGVCARTSWIWRVENLWYLLFKFSFNS